MRRGLSRVWWTALRGIVVYRWALVALAVWFAGKAAWTTVDTVSLRLPPAACGSPIDPSRDRDLDDPISLQCDERLDSARSERTEHLLLASGLVALVLGAYLAASRDWSRITDPPGAALVQLPDIGEIRAPHLIIRRAQPEDLLGFMATIDAEVVEMQGWDPEAVSAVGAAVAQGQPVWASTQQYVAHRPDSTEITAAMSIAAEVTGPSLGWWTAPGSRRQGIATEMVRSTADALFAAGVPFVRFATSQRNHAVHRIAEHLGAENVEHRPITLPNGRREPAVHYRLAKPAGA